jgi:hypothetical protein
MPRSDVLARIWFGLTAAVVLVGLVVQVGVTAGLDGTRFDSAPARVANMFCFFTVQSNLVVGVTTAMLALSLRRRGSVFAVFRLIGVVGITITFLVFHVALSGLQDLEGSAALADFLLHTASPVLCVLGWLLFGPRGRVSARVALWSLLFPVVWLVFTLVRGLAVDYYPYPFLDVGDLGAGRVTLNVVVVALVFVVVVYAAWALDRRIPPNGSHSARPADHGP